MMNDQEMQFADPEWRPRQGQNGTYADAEQQPYAPRPVNDDRSWQEQPQWEDIPERAYKAQEQSPYQMPPPQAQPTMSSPYQYQYSYRQTRRRHSPWIWVVLVLIFFAILGGLMHSSGRSYGPGFVKSGVPAQHVPFNQAQTFKVVGPGVPTIVINDPEGDIQVQEGGGQPVVTVQTDGPDNPVVNHPSSNALNINATDSEDVTVIVPDNANLTIITDGGGVNIANVSAQMTVTSGSGDITMQNVTLTGNSTIKSNDGDITFAGQLDPNGSYQFISTDSGSVGLTLPASSSFSLHATATNGSINADSSFPQVQVQQTNSGAIAQGNNGNAPHANVTISTDNGDINLSAQ